MRQAKTLDVRMAAEQQRFDGRDLGAAAIRLTPH